MAVNERPIQAFEGFVERLLQTALVAHKRSAIVDQLQYALANRVVIERAIGMIMGRDAVDAPAAFERLRSRRARQRAAHRRK